MNKSLPSRAELLKELGNIEGFLSLDDRRRRPRESQYNYGALYLITSRGYYICYYGPYDNTYALTPEEYEQAVAKVSSGEIDWDDCTETVLWMVKKNCKPGIVYADLDCGNDFLDTTVNHEEGFLESLEFVEWNDVKTPKLRIWLDRVNSIRRGYALLK